MEFGVTIPHFGPAARPGMVEAIAQEAEALELDALWTSDHVILPADAGALPAQFYDPLMVMAAAAAVTQHIRIGVSVLVLPYRDPVLTAKMVASLDHASGGRVILGIGVGWVKPEFQALGADFAHRGAITDEYLDCMQTLWTTDPSSFRGATKQFSTMRMQPKPAQDPLPLWVGGNSPAAIRRAAERGTGWHPINLDSATFTAGAQAYRAACERAERAPGPICLRSMPGDYAGVGGMRAPFTGDAGRIAADVEKFAEAGMTQILFAPLAQSLDDQRREMHKIAEDVRARVQV